MPKVETEKMVLHHGFSGNHVTVVKLPSSDWFWIETIPGYDDPICTAECFFETSFDAIKDYEKMAVGSATA